VKLQRSFVWCYRPRINVRDGLQHVQLLRRRDHLHEETLRTRDSQRRVQVQAHWTTVQLCPASRARLWLQRQHVPQLVSSQVSSYPCDPGHPRLGAEVVWDMISNDRCPPPLYTYIIFILSIPCFPGVPACQTWTSSSARAGTTIRAPEIILVVRTRGACPSVRCACPC